MSSRVLRAGIRTSEAINKLSDRTFRLWSHLLTAFDDFGLVELTYGAIKEAAPLQPWDRDTVEQMLGELVDAGLILPYDADGRRHAACAKWQAVINTVKPRCPVPSWGLTHCRRPYGYKDKACREAAERLMPHAFPDSAATVVPGRDTSGTPVVPAVVPLEVPGSVPRVAPTGEEGVRGKGVKITTGETTAVQHGSGRGTRLAQDWILPAHWQAWAQDHARLMGSSLSQDQVLAMADQFRDYWHAKPGAGAVKLDWLGTWRNWVRTDMNRQPRPRMQPDQISVTSGI